MPPVDILSTFIKADYQRSLLLFTCLTLDLHATDAEPRLALLVAFYTFSGRWIFRVFRKILPVFRGLPEESSEVFRKSLPGLPEESSGVFQQSSEVFRKSLSGLPCLPLGSRAKTWCSRQINPFQI